ncbi:hypothetical protein OG738_09360 [Amycolatopsis sp. NBC_01488]|uniref:hypothetical protein n=1 Tax=Amycolatopsis sp. NBC_01488 TaxID=2903563 RepID=UPI002E28970B|nr:hypothetical protein [Amycolatopsis sp. NBC_01488]
MEFPVDDMDRARQLAHELWPHVAHEIGLGPKLGLLVRNVHVDRPGTVFTDILVHIRYHITYEGIEVYPLQIIVGTTLDGQIRRVMKDFDTLYVADTRPTVSGVDADMIAVNRSELPYAEMHYRTLIVHATGEPGEPPRLAWMIKLVGRGRVTGHKIGDDRVIIDAHSGDVLSYQARSPRFPFFEGHLPPDPHPTPS